MEIKEIQINAKKLQKYLELKTFPLAIKLLKEEKEIPLEAKRPLKDFSHHLSLCQAFAISRREGIPLAMLKEDMWCFYPVIGLGMAEVPQYFLEGNSRYPRLAKSIKAGKNWAESLPRFDTGKYKGITFIPLHKTTFGPDLILVYCNPTQLTQIFKAVTWIDGNDVNCRLSGDVGCVYSIVLALQNKQLQVTIPCMGDRVRGLAEENEMIFSFPIDRLGNLVEGLETLDSNNEGIPYKFKHLPEYKLKESYIKISKLMGMDLGNEY